MTKLELIEKKIKNLPVHALDEVDRYIDSISQHKKRKRKRHLKQDWAGCLKEDKNKYTSVELQHLISEQWGKAF